MARVQIAEILELPPADRVAIVQEIWDSLAANPDAMPVTAEQRAELDRRWEALRRDPDAGEPWDSVRQSLADEE